MISNPVLAALDFIEASHASFHSTRSADTVDLRVLENFDVLDDANALVDAGALGPALRKLAQAAAVAARDIS
jgi:hypothetical protein